MRSVWTSVAIDPSDRRSVAVVAVVVAVVDEVAVVAVIGAVGAASGVDEVADVVERARVVVEASEGDRAAGRRARR